MAFIYLTPSTSTCYFILKYFSLVFSYFQIDAIAKGKGKKKKKKERTKITYTKLNNKQYMRPHDLGRFTVCPDPRRLYYKTLLLFENFTY